MKKRDKKKSITIPRDLAKLLVAKPRDLKNPKDYKNVQALAKSCLNLLLKAGV